MYTVSWAFEDPSQKIKETPEEFTSIGDLRKAAAIASHSDAFFDKLDSLAFGYGGSMDYLPKVSSDGRSVRMAYSFDSPEGREAFMDALKGLYPKPLWVKFSERAGGLWGE